MANHIETLEKAREQLVAARRRLADKFSASAGFRNAFIELQTTINLIDRAIDDEKKLAQAAPASQVKFGEGQG